jgi:hypothetical protein
MRYTALACPASGWDAVDLEAVLRRITAVVAARRVRLAVMTMIFFIVFC